MSTHPSKEYKALMNYFHNELKITKEDIREWTQEAVERTAQRYIDVTFTKDFASEIIRKELQNIVNSKEFSWWESEDTLDEWVKKEVVDRLLKGVHLKVDIVGSKKQESAQHKKVKIRTTRRKK